MKNTIKRIVSMILVLAILVIGASAALADTDMFKTTGRLYLRMGPGTGYDSITCMDKGEKVSYLDDSYAADGSCWFKVQRSDGTKGWCCSDYLTYVNPTPVTGSKVKLSGDAYVRKSASLNGSKLGVAKKGTTLTYDDTAKDSRGVLWYHVSFNGKTGWVSSKYAKKI